jgi:hypothetical protein
MSAERFQPRATRYDIRAAVQYRLAAGGEWSDGHTVNISRTGMLIDAAGPDMPPGSSVHAVLAMAHTADTKWMRVLCRGEVVRTTERRPGGHGGLVAMTIDEYEFLPPSRGPLNDRPPTIDSTGPSIRIH